jgi:hypothetical protein
MTSFENELRAMLTDPEVALLDRYLSLAEVRDGAIASLVARTLRELAEKDMIDFFYPKPE